MMEIRYAYVKARQEFGKQCLFDLCEPVTDETIYPRPEDLADYLLRNPCHVASQNSTRYAVHEAQTDDVATKESGLFHREGGWPKEIDFKDDEASARFRKRFEREDNWAPKMRSLMKPMEHYAKQNNAINIYENYFDETIPQDLVLPPTARVVNVYADPQPDARPVTNVSWSSDNGGKMAVSYCCMDFQRVSSTSSPISYVWSIENPNDAFATLEATCPSVAIEFHPRYPSILASGMTSGQVASWDVRRGSAPVILSDPRFGHRDPVNVVLWIHSNTNTDFFSASTDGMLMRWDVRMLRQPVEILSTNLKDPRSIDAATAVGISSMNYESATRTKFLVGLENGTVINGSRKGKTPAEKLAHRFNCHFGPVFSVERNPFSQKVFLTVGDWTCRVWSEDTREGCLTSTPFMQVVGCCFGENCPAVQFQKNLLSAGCWSASRSSVFFTADSKGDLKVWDLLAELHRPVTVLRLCNELLTRLRAHQSGKLVAVGNRGGKVYLVELSEGLTSMRQNEKALMSSLVERCGRYQKVVDNRLRELRLARRVRLEDTNVGERVEGTEDERMPTSGKSTGTKNKARSMRWVDRFLKLDERLRAAIAANSRRRRKKMREDSKQRRMKMGEEGESDATGRKRLNDGLDVDLVKAETEYFAVVEKELERYADLEDEEGLVNSRGVSRTHQKTRHRQEVARKTERTKSERRGRGKTRIHETERDVTTPESVGSPGASRVSDSTKEEVVPSEVRQKRVRQHRKRSKSKISWVEKPCDLEGRTTLGVCRPEICCSDESTSRLKKRSSPRRRKVGLSSGDEESTGPRTDSDPTAREVLLKSLGIIGEEARSYNRAEKAEILRKAKGKPSAINFETVAAKEFVERESSRVRKKSAVGARKHSLVPRRLEPEHKVWDAKLLGKKDEPTKLTASSPVRIGGNDCAKLGKPPRPLEVIPPEMTRLMPRLPQLRRSTFDAKTFSRGNEETAEGRMYPRLSAYPTLRKSTTVITLPTRTRDLSTLADATDERTTRTRKKRTARGKAAPGDATRTESSEK